MKYIFKLLILILFTSCSSQSNETIDFKVGYKANREYKLSQTQISENIVKYIASDEILNNLKNNGVQNPTITKDTTNLKSISKTGELNGNWFPVRIEMLNSISKKISKGTKIYGNVSIDGKTILDSIVSQNMTSEYKNSLLRTIENGMNQLKYPERKISIDESFEQKSSMTIPISDVNIILEINSVYTLKKVENNIGYFDLKQDYLLKSKDKDYKVNLTGNGKGEIEYDINNGFFTKNTTEMEMNLLVELEVFSIDLKSKSRTELIVIIE